MENRISVTGNMDLFITDLVHVPTASIHFGKLLIWVVVTWKVWKTIWELG